LNPNLQEIFIPVISYGNLARISDSVKTPSAWCISQKAHVSYSKNITAFQLTTIDEREHNHCSAVHFGRYVF